MTIWHPIKKQFFSTALFIILAVAAVWQQQAFAVSCSPVKGAMNATVQLQGGNLTVGPDVSNGTIIYRLTFVPSRDSRDTQVACTENTIAYQPTMNWYYSNTPNTLSSWNGAPFAGKVYRTGVPGIGVAIYANNSTNWIVPFTQNAWGEDLPTTRNTIYWQASTGFSFDLVLIKTGAISTNTVNGEQLPTLQYDFQAPGINDINLGKLTFSGSINIVSQTCETNNPEVPMGTYEASTDFSGEGSSTEWKDAAITLTNCPTFYGTLNDGRNTWYSDNNDFGIGSYTNNILNLVLSPNTAIIDSANGILGLVTDSESATGVGIQMAYGSTSDSSPTLVDFSSSKNYTMVQNASAAAYTLPLIARYIQTGSTITPGKANATVTFTINYY